MANDTATQLRRLAGFLMDMVHRADQQASNLARLAGELDDMVPLARVEEAVQKRKRVARSLIEDGTLDDKAGELIITALEGVLYEVRKGGAKG